MSKHPANDARPYTETSALRDILQWSKTRPDWLRDGLRRLMVASDLSALDIDELEAICLGIEGDASPLSDEHIAVGPRRSTLEILSTGGSHAKSQYPAPRPQWNQLC